MYRNLMVFALAALCLLVDSYASAGSFKANPVRIFMDARSKTAVVKVTNTGDEKVTVQLDAKSWRQDETSKDIYEETGDIIFFPKIVEIGKGEERIIRIGYRGLPQLEEKAYRLFFEELPVSTPGSTALKLVLSLSIPIFLTPEKAISDWSAGFAGFSEERLGVKVDNKGNEHVTIYKIRATGLDEAGGEVFKRNTGGWHVLARSAKVFPVSIPPGDCLKASTIRVSADMERGTDYEKSSKEFSINVEKAMCSPKPAVPKVKAEDKVKTEDKTKAEGKGKTEEKARAEEKGPN